MKIIDVGTHIMTKRHTKIIVTLGPATTLNKT